MRFLAKNNKDRAVFYVVVNLIITMLSIFCSMAIIKFCITNDIAISNYLITFGLFDIGFFVMFVYFYKLINYISTLNYLKRVKLSQINKELFDELINKIKVELNPTTYLVLGISAFMIFVCLASNGVEADFEMNKIVVIRKMILSLITFAAFEFVSVIVIFAILKLVRKTKLGKISVAKLSSKLYFIFIKFINYLSIKFSQVKEIILNFYKTKIIRMHSYDLDQKNIISIKRSNFLNIELKGECPPVISFF
ncbi:hypothetical protein [Spiroplasma endosymbiont of Diplazon laetatorius]|uniref:hypothetical protein n=1 Tax=Spiroplasma endosymbiont of Diplazon laetatorius TaxID=3066322 RepID=UPI0030CC6972